MVVLLRDVDRLESLGAPPLRQRPPGDGSHGAYLLEMWHPHQEGVRYIAVSQHDAVNGAGVKRTAFDSSRAVRRQVDVHALSKRQEALVERASADSFECDGAVGTNHADVDHPGSVLHEPGHDGVVQRDFALNPALQVQLVGADDASDLLHGGLNLTVSRVVVCIRMLLHHLLQLFDLESRLSQRVFEEQQNCGLVV